MNTDKRYIPVESSIIDACKEIKAMRNGTLTEPTLKDFFADMQALIVQEEFNASHTDKTLQGRR